MNCTNHPDVTAVAFCQNCGKPQCEQCVRPVAGIVYCEACLAARLSGQAAPGGTAYTVPGSAGPGVNYTVNGITPPPSIGPRPGLAAVLGFIPGVGAMYNGQFIKGLIHVAIFAALCNAADHFGFFGFFIATWIFYQVFDAYQTAKARRDGLPLPDPFGLNDIGTRMGITPSHTASAPADAAAVPPVPPAAAAAPGPVPPPPGATGPAPEQPYAPYPPNYAADVPPPGVPSRSGPPTGAIVLIALGVIFLLQSLSILNWNWIGSGWPVLLIGLGIWLVIKRSREVPPGGGL